MIRHIVMWKVDKIPQDRRMETAEDLARMLMRLGESVHAVVSTEVGIQEEEPPLMVLSMIFGTWEDLEDYRVHEDHVAAVKVLRKHTTKLGAVDYEIQ